MAWPGAPLSRWPLVAGAALVGVVATAAAFQLREKAPAGASAFRIEYDVEDGTSGTTHIETVEVDRPTVSRRLRRDGGSATTESGVYDRSPAGEWRQLAVVGPGEPGQDLQLAAPLAWAEREGLARRDGDGSIAGRRCTWWVTSEPLDTAPFGPAASGDETRSCVDQDGRLLADRWQADNRELRRRTATSVVALKSVSVFDGETPAPVIPQLVTAVVERLSDPPAALVRPTPPGGFELRSATLIVEIEPGTTNVVRRTHRVVYSGEGVVVVLDQVRPLEPVEPRGDRPVDLGRLGSGRVRATGGGIVVEVAVGKGLLRVRSGLEWEPLVRWLKSLEQVTDGARG